MDVKDFSYELPQRLIAQDPLEDRSSSRLMVLDKNTGRTEDKYFRDIKDYLRRGDCLVINDTKVIPARLFGRRPGKEEQIEVLLLRRIEADLWETLVRPGKKCRPGTVLEFGDGILTAVVEDIVEEGNRLIRFKFDGIWEEVLDRLGQMPLPPYITHQLKDKTRYNTVYAEHDGSAAAPTAGLHFTRELLDEIEQMGVDIVHVTLHVGLGTFRPVKEKNVLDHHMHSEFYIVTDEAAERINAAKARGDRIICVGTTSCRTVESATDDSGIIHAKSDWTRIFIYPGYRFKMMDALITNFHLPESTLIMLVSALAGREHVLEAYKKAVRLEYRFFSFGDAMFIADFGGKERLLRIAEDRDYDIFKKIQTERYYGDDPDAEAMIDMMWSIRDSGDMRIYTIASDDKAVGFIVVSDPYGVRPNIGIDVCDEYQNRGYATQAMRELPFRKYKFETEENNGPANRVALKLGLEKIGEENIEGYKFILWDLKEQENI